MRQVGYLQRLYRDARSTEHKIWGKGCVSINVVNDVSGLQKIVAGNSPECRQLQTDLQGVMGQKT